MGADTRRLQLSLSRDHSPDCRRVSARPRAAGAAATWAKVGSKAPSRQPPRPHWAAYTCWTFHEDLPREGAAAARPWGASAGGPRQDRGRGRAAWAWKLPADRRATAEARARVRHTRAATRTAACRQCATVWLDFVFRSPQLQDEQSVRSARSQCSKQCPFAATEQTISCTREIVRALLPRTRWPAPRS